MQDIRKLWDSSFQYGRGYGSGWRVCMGMRGVCRIQNVYAIHYVHPINECKSRSEYHELLVCEQKKTYNR